MRKIFLLAFLLITFLSGKQCDYQKKMIVIFENTHEKIFELKGTIYKLIKNRGSDSVLMLLDEKSHKYITITNDIKDDNKNDDEVLELMVTQ